MINDSVLWDGNRQPPVFIFLKISSEQKHLHVEFLPTKPLLSDTWRLKFIVKSNKRFLLFTARTDTIISSETINSSYSTRSAGHSFLFSLICLLYSCVHEQAAPQLCVREKLWPTSLGGSENASRILATEQPGCLGAAGPQRWEAIITPDQSDQGCLKVTRTLAVDQSTWGEQQSVQSFTWTVFLKPLHYWFHFIGEKTEA